MNCSSYGWTGYQIPTDGEQFYIGRSNMQETVWHHAQSFGLARFGASDYHGLGKTNRLGEYLTAPSVVEDLVAGTHLEVIRP
ncbi:Uncharacterised protein [Actinobaculum suis]|uniref:Uncharacterized protein n=2 Tax=Actinobaculum suis TaxID=1657 RepID=A0A7Z8Y8C8_9ACTO|nr:Uncharacterised protein [Actinobaculum suis]